MSLHRIMDTLVLQAVFDYEKTDYHSELYSMLAIIYSQLNNYEGTTRYFRKHIDLFGAEHARSYRVVFHLDKMNKSIPW